MGSKNESICRLCLKVQKNDFQKIGEFMKQILSVLMLKLELDITRDPVICEDCTKIAKRSLNFKSTCIDTEEIIVLYSADKEKTRHNIRDIYEKKEHVLTFIDKHLDICRFCFTRLEKNNFVSLDSLMNETMVEMLSEYMPETDMDVIENPIICMICRENLDVYFKFVTNCLDTESKIKAYCKEKGTNSTGEVTLGNILHFLFRYVLQDPEKFSRTSKIKQEPNAFMDTDHVHHELHSELTKIEEEEVDIKEEEICLRGNLSEIIDKYEDTLRSDQLDKEKNSDRSLETREDNTERSVLQKQVQIEIERILVIKAKRIKSSDKLIDKRMLCTDETQLEMGVKEKKADLIKDSGVSEVNERRYTLRSSKQQHISKTPLEISENYEAKQKSNPKKRKDISEIKKHKCSMCPYRTEKKSRVTRHMLVHMDPSEIVMHKCPLCNFEGKQKSSITTHMMVHKNISKINMLKCSLCAFETKRKGSIRNHMLVHKDVLKLKSYKCSVCAYKAKRNGDLKKHMATHKDVSEINMYNCSFCTYASNANSKLIRHMLTHKDVSEIKMHKCILCPFKTKHKGNLKSHMLVHTDISEIEMSKCSVCPFEAKKKNELDRHMLVHKDPSEVEWYKCSSCAFETKRKGSLVGHMLIHKDASELEMYKCTLCPHETKKKGELKRHMLVHKDPSEIKMYECSLCAHKSKTKGNLVKHINSVHKDISELKMYKCSVCSYKFKYKSNLTSHMIVHKDISEIETFKCSLCAHEAKRKGDLVVHMMVHRTTPEAKKFKCSLCSHRSRNRGDLNKHMLTHGVYKEKMHKCSLCAYRAKHKRDLKKHMLTH